MNASGIYAIVGCIKFELQKFGRYGDKDGI